jgi:hypothetical protein
VKIGSKMSKNKIPIMSNLYVKIKWWFFKKPIKIENMETFANLPNLNNSKNRRKTPFSKFSRAYNVKWQSRNI